MHDAHWLVEEAIDWGDMEESMFHARERGDGRCMYASLTGVGWVSYGVWEHAMHLHMISYS